VKWKEVLEEDPGAEKVKVTATSAAKRKAATSDAVSTTLILEHSCSNTILIAARGG
jgi:hypothetical protein